MLTNLVVSKFKPRKYMQDPKKIEESFEMIELANADLTDLANLFDTITGMCAAYPAKVEIDSSEQEEQYIH